MNLTTIPTNLSPELQVLMLTGNNISHLSREEFVNLRLVNLQKIHLKATHIRWVHREAFKDLKILVEIDLSNNLIEAIDKQTFSGNDRLRILLLSGNPIKKLVADQFPVLPYFRNLELERCNIVNIHETAFSNLDLLESLNLKHNKLVRLPENVFTHMKNLKTLKLEDNPWRCDCDLKQFKVWYNRKGYPSLVCAEPPSLKDAKWEAVDAGDFGCLPQLDILKDEYQLEELGMNVTYKCMSRGDPLPTITWDVNGKLLDEGESVRIEEERIGSSQLWSNLTVFNLTSFDTGIYTCSAHNRFGFVNRNFSIILPETIFPVLTRTPETFWYFGLIVGIFSSIFALMFISIAICICKKFANRRRRKKTNIKSSVSFNDQEKKLLDLSITTNEKQDSSEIVNTPSTAKTDSIIALEPVQITIENIARNEEFPLNVGVFPPPPEFRSNVVPTTPYGNIFISVSLTQDALNDNPHIDMYPDLLNIPKRLKSGKFVPVNVSSYATLPRPATANGRPQPPSAVHCKPSMMQPLMPAVVVPGSVSAETVLNEPPTIMESYPGSEENCELASNVCLVCRKNDEAAVDYYHPVCENVAITLNYDNTGRRVTASGTTVLPPPDEALEHHHQDTDELDAATATTTTAPTVAILPVEQPQQSFLNLHAKEISISTLPPPPPPPQLAGNDFVSL